MTTSIQTPFLQHISDGVDDSFTYNWLTPSTGEMVVFLKPDGGLQQVVSPSLYTVTGVGSPAGGLVNFTTAPVSGIIALVRNTPEDQTLEILNTGSFQRSLIEIALDKLTRMHQDLSASFNKTGVRVEETDTADSIDAQALLQAATDAENSAVAADASATSASASAAVATGVADTIEDDANTAVTDATDTLVPPAVAVEVTAQVQPAVDTAVGDSITTQVIPAAEAEALQTTTDYLDANLTTLVTVETEQIATPLVADEVADQVPPAVDDEVTRVVNELIFDIQQAQALKLVDDAMVDRQREWSNSGAKVGGFLASMEVTDTMVVPQEHRFVLIADRIASGAEIIIENGAEVVYDPTNLVYNTVVTGAPPEINKVTLSSYGANEDAVNTTTTLNGTTTVTVETVDNVDWKESTEMHFVNVGGADCDFVAATDVIFVPAGPYVIEPENQLVAKLIDIDASGGKWLITKATP